MMNNSESELKNLLIGMELREYHFVPSRFLLYLSSTVEREGQAGIQISFGDFWWFDDQDEWKQSVSKCGVGVDPEITMLDLMLTALNCAEDKTIVDLTLSKDHLALHFGNGVVIHSMYPKDDYDICFFRISTSELSTTSGETLFEGT